MAETEPSEKAESVCQNVCNKLSDVKTDFVRVNKTTNAIAIGFPDSETRNSAKQILDDISSQGYSLKEKKKMLPKLTIENVHRDDAFRGLTATTDEELRDEIRQQLVPSIISKNPGVKKLVDAGHTMEIVFMSRFSEFNKYFTFALKVSPAIRLHIMNEQGRALWFGNTCHPVSDRVHLISCYHCQALGHTSGETCPKKAALPTCFRCSGEHKSKECDKKSTPGAISCARCKDSKNPEDNKHHKTHNAASMECPVMKRHMQRLIENTDFTSKNVM